MGNEFTTGHLSEKLRNLETIINNANWDHKWHPNPDSSIISDLHIIMKTYLVAASYDLTFSITPLIDEIASSHYEAKHAFASAQANRIVPTDDGKIAICTNPSVMIFDPKSLSSKPTTYSGHQTNVTDVVFNGSTFYTCSEDRTCKIWSRTIPRYQASFNTSSSLNSIYLMPNKNQVITSNEKGHIEMWDNRKFDRVFFVKIASFPIRSLAVNKEGTRLVAVTHNGQGHIYNITDSGFEKVLEFPTNHTIPLRVIISPDENFFVTTGSDSKARLWEFETGKQVGIFENSSMTKYLWDASYTPDGKYLCTGGTDKLARVWDSSNQSLVASFDWHGKGLTCLSVMNF